MKLMLFLVIVMFKCSRLSSAPTLIDEIADAQNDKNLQTNKNDGKITAHHASSSVSTQSFLPPFTNYGADDEDYGTGDNGVVFQFRRSIKSDNTEIEARRRSALDKNFMRFGRMDPEMNRFRRTPDKNLMRFGRAPEKNLLRFGRAQDKNLLRFGRAPSSDKNLMRFGRAPDKNILRFGRNPENIVKTRSDGFMRFGRAPATDKNLLRFGRKDKSFNDYDENTYDVSDEGPDPNKVKYNLLGKNIMRLGRSSGELQDMDNYESLEDSVEGSNKKYVVPSSKNLMRLGRDEKNLMRFGRSGNFMRFGRNSKPLLKSSYVYCVDDKCLVDKNSSENLEKDEMETKEEDVMLNDIFSEPKK